MTIAVREIDDLVQKGAADVRLGVFARLFHDIADVEGNIAECGVRRGRSLSLLAWLAMKEGNGRHIFGFDAWDLGVENGWRSQIELHHQEGKPVGFMPFSEAITVLREKMIKRGIPEDTYTLVPGWLENTVPRTATGPVALLHLDVDVYESYKHSLELLWPRMPSGGVAVFDEYHQPGIWPGCRQAVDEFLRDRPHEMHEGTRYWARKL